MDNSELDKRTEMVAMNIVHQIGDALYDALPKDVAHEHFVDARQATNDIAIDFATKLILSEALRIGMEAIGVDDQFQGTATNHMFIDANNQLRHKQRKKLLKLTEGEKK